MKSSFPQLHKNKLQNTYIHRTQNLLLHKIYPYCAKCCTNIFFIVIIKSDEFESLNYNELISLNVTVKKGLGDFHEKDIINRRGRFHWIPSM